MKPLYKSLSSIMKEGTLWANHFLKGLPLNTIPLASKFNSWILEGILMGGYFLPWHWMRNVPHSLRCLNTWYLVGGARRKWVIGGRLWEFIASPHFQFPLSDLCLRMEMCSLRILPLSLPLIAMHLLSLNCELKSILASINCLLSWDFITATKK